MPDHPSPQASLGHFSLPQERKSLTHRFSIGTFKAYITVGLYGDGKPGELYITTSKQGSEISGMCQALAISISIGLQSGVPLERYIEKFKHMRFEPMGFTNNSDIHIAKSIMDYIARWLENKFVADMQPKQIEVSGGASIQQASVAMGCKSDR